MDWLRNVGSALLAAAMAFLAFFAVKQAATQRKQKQRWQDRATEEAMRPTEDALTRFEKAQQRAKQHDAKAQAELAKGQARIDRIGAADESMADILDRWRAERLRDDQHA